MKTRFKTMALRLVAVILVAGSLVVVTRTALGLSIIPGDLGTSVNLTALVRHQVSQQHCYDTGNYECEEPSGARPAFSKEFTLGYLFKNRHQPGLGLTALYTCQDTRRHATGMHFVLSDSTDGDARRLCRSLGMRPQQLGYVASQPNFEGAQSLYRCWNSNLDSLLTDDLTECDLAAYFVPDRLGYMVSGSTLPVRRLRELCQVASSPHCAILADAATTEPSDNTAVIEFLKNNISH